MRCSNSRKYSDFILPLDKAEVSSAFFVRTKTKKMIPESELILNQNGSVYHLNLLPNEISNKIITVGDPERVAKVSAHFDSVEVIRQKREFVIHTGYYQGKRLTVLSTGMGTDNIEIALTELDALVNIDLKTRTIKPNKTVLEIVRIGTSGSLQSIVPVDSQLFSKRAIGLDALMNFYSYPHENAALEDLQTIKRDLGLDSYPYLAECSEDLAVRIAYDMTPGLTATAPGFYAPQGRILRLSSRQDNLLGRLNAVRLKDDSCITNLEMETAGIYAMAKLLGHKALSISAIVAHRLQNKFSTQADEVIDNIIKKVLDRF